MTGVLRMILDGLEAQKIVIKLDRGEAKYALRQ